MAETTPDTSSYDFMTPEQGRAMEQEGCFVVENALPPTVVAEIDAAIDELYDREKAAGRLPEEGRLNLRNCVTEHDAFLQLIDWPTTFPKAMGILNWNIHLITSQLLVQPPKDRPEQPMRVGLHRDGGTSAREMTEPHPKILFKIGYVISDQSDPASGATVLVPGSNRYIGGPSTDPETGGARGGMRAIEDDRFVRLERANYGPGVRKCVQLKGPPKRLGFRQGCLADRIPLGQRSGAHKRDAR